MANFISWQRGARMVGLVLVVCIGWGATAGAKYGMFVSRLGEDTLAEVFRWEDSVRALRDQAAHVESIEDANLYTLSEAVWPVLYQRAPEDALDDALAFAWASVGTPSSGSTDLVEPMRLAMAHFEVYLRRFAGLDQRTEVPDLATESGCDVELIKDGWVRRYGQSIVEPTAADSRHVSASLDALARTTACHSQRQLAVLEAASVAASLEVLRAMRANQLEDLEAPFHRLLAPWMAIVLDARKHRGEFSLSRAWFEGFAGELQAAVGQSGWATSELMLWDRRGGVLVGFSDCSLQSANRCVDLQQFMESITDPRSLGLGQCGMAGMIEMGTENIDGDPRYVCPMSSCSSNAPSPAESGWHQVGGGWQHQGNSVSGLDLAGPMATAPDSGIPTGSGLAGPGTGSPLDSIWPSASPGTFQSLGGFCLPGGGTEGQGIAIPDLENCFSEMGGTTNPFEQHLACVADAIGDGEPPMIGGSMNGVPGRGLRCGLANGAEAQTPPATPEPATPPPAAEKPWYVRLGEWIAGKLGIATGAADVGTQMAAKGVAKSVASGGVGAAAGVGVGMGTTLLDPDLGPKAVEGAMTGALALALRKMEARGQITLDEYQIQRGKLSSDPAGVQQWIQQRKAGGGAQGCFDPLSCSGECTGLGEQVAAMEACNEELLDGLAEAAGLPSRNDLQRDLGPYINPNPEDPNTYGDADFPGAACLSQNGPAQGNPACGLILCGDGALAAPSGPDCKCGSNAGGAIPDAATIMCMYVMCAEVGMGGEFGDCSCFPEVEMEEGGGGLGPMPGPKPFTSVLGVGLDEGLEIATDILGIDPQQSLFMEGSPILN